MQELSMDEYFLQLNQDIPLVNEGKEKILQAVNAYLQCSIQERNEDNAKAEISNRTENRVQSLAATLQVFATPEGEKAVHYLSDMRRLWCIMRFLSLEQKSNLSSFALGCETADDLIEKYELTIYSLRRILFQISDASCAEAISYLQNTMPSHIAVYFILKNEQLQKLSVWKVFLPALLGENPTDDADCSFYSAETKNTGWTKQDCSTFVSLLSQAE